MSFRTALAVRNLLFSREKQSASSLSNCVLNVIDLMRAQTIAAVVFLGIGTLVTVGKYIGIAQARRTRVGYSCIPLLGGLFGCAGLLLIPKGRVFSFLPLLADIGCVPMMLALLVYVLKRGPDPSRNQ